MDDLSIRKLSNIEDILDNDRLRFIKGDVNNYRDISEVMLSKTIDIVFHYADADADADTDTDAVGVQYTQAHPVRVLRDISGIQHMCSLRKKSAVKRIFFSSSSEVYGEPVEIPQNEDTTPLNSKVPYAVVKNSGESFLRCFHHFANVYHHSYWNHSQLGDMLWQPMY
jgi:UDP-glucuronate decarboxylase